ncbi:hypothetical protein EDB85DRAFT_2035027, partial [Lactarius pseudohatsudake]
VKVNKLIQVSYESPIRLRVVNSGNELLLASTIESKVGESREDSSYYSSCHRKQACPIKAGSSRLEDKGFERDHVTQALEKRVHLGALIGLFLQEAPVYLRLHRSCFSAAFSNQLLSLYGSVRGSTFLDFARPFRLPSGWSKLFVRCRTVALEEQFNAYVDCHSCSLLTCFRRSSPAWAISSSARPPTASETNGSCTIRSTVPIAVDRAGVGECRALQGSPGTSRGRYAAWYAASTGARMGERGQGQCHSCE